jgi:hypothetical protein
VGGEYEHRCEKYVHSVCVENMSTGVNSKYIQFGE